MSRVSQKEGNVEMSTEEVVSGDIEDDRGEESGGGGERMNEDVSRKDKGKGEESQKGGVS